ncbi:MAG: hypothetical protein KME35_01910 [Aphanocapsa sp. GSE-SYN-MK-11-07L]|nr:hypothetical protein [Aphanocapsa sp. GSE-SYN-MK-11-07L]
MFQRYFVNLFQPYLNPKGLLIDPCDRLRFALPLLLCTILLNLGLTHLYTLVDTLAAGLTNPSPNPFLRGALSGGFWGGANAVLQWLLIRRYIPDQKWIVAVLTGWILIHVGVANVSDILVDSGKFGIQPEQSLFFVAPSPEIQFLAELISSPLYLVSGVLEWLVLRRYVGSAAWWIALQLFSCYLTLGLHLQYYFGAAALFGPLHLDFFVFQNTIYILIFSIGFCFFVWSRGQSTSSDPSLAVSPLTSAPQVNGFWQTNQLVIALKRHLSEAWQVEFSCPEPLTYLLGVDRSGTIVDCLAANQTAATWIDQTPLRLLISSGETGIDSQPPLARIQVSFDSLGHLQIHNCRNVSIVEMAAVLLVRNFY